ncbi:hypothetical protein C5O00_10515 [Pukyongia salina]|uniref:Uncharacterized protein n=2 Tax=Pukyongia salina TaxID=2094025 RepID=A0A2S0I0L5_9FLAO|nr:hypothetical protein C5O00_10515 [Pukyongia salina]
MKKRSVIVISLVVLLILLIPLIGMQFTENIKWGPMDFLVAAVLLFGVGFVLDLTLRKIKKPRSRVLISIAIIVLFLLIWAELAVGVFGTPLAGN